MDKQWEPDMNIIGLSGSLRAKSTNSGLLRAAGTFAPNGVEIMEYHDVPIYNGDDEAASGIPARAKEIADALEAADALIIACPEYNFSLPGGLKNLIDWISRIRPTPFAGKPTAILGAAPGPIGTARVQYELRKVLSALDANLVGKPEVFVGLSGSKFDANGDLTDETSLEFVGKLMDALVKKAGG